MSDHETRSIAAARLLNRLNKIGKVLSQRDGTLALLGLGSCGIETSRLDGYSDLDFFVIADADVVPQMIEDIGWLAAVAPLSFTHRNTADGWKVLFADGIFAEFAVFDVQKLKTIPFAKGRLVWKRHDVDESWFEPSCLPAPSDRGWLFNEALSCLWCGLNRFHRGEWLSALRFIQGHALDLVLQLDAFERPNCKQSAVSPDVFNASRRFEQRYPQSHQWLSEAASGYGTSLAAARALFDHLDGVGPIDPAMRAAIVPLLEARK